jgi:hypothetical protein
LYFTNGDPVSIHTLAAAGYKIIRDVTEQTGTDPMLIKGSMLDYVKPERKSALVKKINEAENFFKHAGRDHEAMLEFKPELTDLHMIDACAQYTKLTSEDTALFVTYRVWLMARHPELFILGEQFTKTFQNVASIVNMTRAQYFSTALPLFMSID